MVGQYGISLAVSLITDHFGTIVAKVCDCLLRHGTISLQECIRFTQLSPSQVKNSFLVLIQHNCVQAFSIAKPSGAGGGARTVTQYMVIFDSIIHRLRFTKFLAIVKEDLGSECEKLFEGLLQHGRLTFEQLVVRASSKQSEGKRDSLRPTFDRLVRSYYIERCPRPEPFITESTDNVATKKRTSKSAEGSLSIEQQAIMGATLLDGERFCGISDKGAGVTSYAKDTPQSPEVLVGEKRKHEVLEAENEVEAVITENEILWRVNFEKFVNCLMKKACVENVRARMSLDAGLVLEALVERSGQDKVKDKHHVKSSLDSIMEELMEKTKGRLMTRDRVRPILDELGCCLANKETGSQYSIDLRNIIQNCQNDEIEALVLKRYGQEAYRIFRLLAKKGRLCETDSISESAMLEKKDAQRLLYKLWKDNYFDMQKIVNQAAGQAHFFWKVNKDALQQHVLEEMYHAALNLSRKIADVVDQEHEVLQVKEKQKLKLSRRILESSLLKLDDALMLFHDFL